MLICKLSVLDGPEIWLASLAETPLIFNQTVFVTIFFCTKPQMLLSSPKLIPNPVLTEGLQGAGIALKGKKIR
jgi:hypothetical protein